MKSKGKVLALFLCFIAVVFAYSNSLNASFHWDDYHAIVKNPSIRTFKGALSTFIKPAGFSFYRVSMIRPISILTYYFNYLADGLNPIGWHIFNLLIHFLNTILVVILARELLAKFVSSSLSSAHLEVGAVCCGLFFAVHPMQSEAVNYLSARSMLLMASFYLSSLILYFKGQRVFSWLLFISALLTREDAVTLPFTLLFIEVLIALNERETMKKDRRIKFKQITYQILSYFGVLGAYLIYRKAVLGELASFSLVRSVGENLVLQVWSVGLYQKIIVTAKGISVSHVINKMELISLWWWLCAFTILIEIVVAVLCLKKKPLLSFCIGWFFLVPSLSIIIPLNQVASEHRVYLAMFAPCMLGGIFSAYALEKSSPYKSGIVVGVLIICLVGILAIITRERNKDWRDERSLWLSALKVYPLNSTAWNRYGLALKDAGDYDGAIYAYKKSLDIEPSSEAYNNLAVACGLKGDGACAWESIRKSLALAPDNPNAIFNFANMLFSDGKVSEAIEAYKKALKVREFFPEAHRNLAIALLAQSQNSNKKEALEHFIKSLQQDPYQADAQKLLQTIKQLAETIKYEGGG